MQKEKDIVVTITENLNKPTKQCAKAAEMAQTVLGQISRAFHYRDRHISSGSTNIMCGHTWSSLHKHDLQEQWRQKNPWNKFRNNE
jgi:hypothetical protein